MTHDIRIIGLDLDGTVLNEKKEITPRVRAALMAAARAGIRSVVMVPSNLEQQKILTTAAYGGTLQVHL